MANTGFKAYTTLEQYNTATGVATGVTKPNTIGDPDYVAPVYDDVYCPLPVDLQPQWIAAGTFNNNQNYIKSSDGVSWTYSRIPTLFDVYSLNYLDSKWFAVGATEETPDFSTTRKVMFSTDTDTWQDITIPIDKVNSINFANGLWVATGKGTTANPNNLATSVDGINWTGRGLVAFDINWLGTEYANGVWVGYGENDSPADGSLAYSTDGINWTNGIYSYLNGAPAFGYDAFHNGSYWLCAGFKFGTNSQVIGKSVDGINWTPFSTGATVDHTGRKLTYFNNKWILGGRGSFELAASTTEGVSWSGTLNSNLIEIRDFEFNVNKIISVGLVSQDVGKIYSSTNGSSWSEVTSTTIGLYTIAIRK